MCIYPIIQPGALVLALMLNFCHGYHALLGNSFLRIDSSAELFGRSHLGFLIWQPVRAMVTLEGLHKEWESDQGIRSFFRDHRRLFMGEKPDDFCPKCLVATATRNRDVLMPLMKRMGMAGGQLFKIAMVEKEFLANLTVQ